MQEERLAIFWQILYGFFMKMHLVGLPNVALPRPPTRVRSAKPRSAPKAGVQSAAVHAYTCNSDSNALSEGEDSSRILIDPNTLETVPDGRIVCGTLPDGSIGCADRMTGAPPVAPPLPRY